MRASRLLSLLITLQARGHATAPALAGALEVSVRTIYRDMEALSAAGVPVYADRGAGGGYRLLDGYRTRLNGLSAQEVEAVFLSGLSGPAAALGLEAAMATAQLKVTAALPAALRTAGDRIRNRFHFDAPGWFHEAEQPVHLQRLATAVWNENLVDIRYRSWKAETRRRVSPLGLVLKAGAWYLAGAVSGSVRTYRVARILDLTLVDQACARPPEFDLAAYWHQNVTRLGTEIYHSRAELRLTAQGFKMIEPFVSPVQRAAMVVGEPDEYGSRVVVLPVGSNWHACTEILRFGTDAEVLGPPDLRAMMRETVARMQRTYAANPPSG